MRSQRVRIRDLQPSLCYALILVFAIAFLAGVLPAQDISNRPDESDSPGFRVEKVQLSNGAELLTIFARTGRLSDSEGEAEVPMVSVLRDTLGDDRLENDRLRYAWMLTYAKPSFWQRAAGYVPFLYTHTSNRTSIGKEPPKPIADIRRSTAPMWNRVLWEVFRRVILNEAAIGVKASALHARRNAQDHKRAAITSALTILSIYESMEGEKLLSDTELEDIQARLWLTDKPLGWHMRDENLPRVYEKHAETRKDTRGANWELLRQYAEAQGLYFDPIEMTDGEARHAMLWVAEEDLAKNKNRKFDSRFLNIKSPWDSRKITDWKGYTETWWFDSENRVVEPNTANATPRTMIPLALYGLEHPKIPVILIDFQDQGNPKRREMSRRILSDLTGNILSISKFSSIPYFVGRFVYDFATGRRGADMNQASRLRSYAQLKMLLALDSSLDDRLRTDLAKRIERVSMNPYESDIGAQIQLARQQYKNLIDYANRPDGLPEKLDNDRREEMVRLAHGSTDRFFYKLGNVFTLGIYDHRERPTEKLLAQLDIRRQLEYHERVLAEVSYKSANPEIDSNVEAVKLSLAFIAEHGAAARVKTAKAISKIFRMSPDSDLQAACLTGLYRINNSTAKKELLTIYEGKVNGDKWRTVTADYLRKALDEGQRISRSDVAAISGIASSN